MCWLLRMGTMKIWKKIPRKIMALETVELNWIIFSESQKKWWICWIFYEWIFPELSTLTPYMVSWLSHQIDFFLANFLRISLATITWSCHALGVFLLLSCFDGMAISLRISFIVIIYYKHCTHVPIVSMAWFGLRVAHF